MADPGSGSDLKSRGDNLLAGLEEIIDYFDQRADADCGGDPPRYIPNEEMRLYQAAVEVKDYIHKLDMV